MNRQPLLHRSSEPAGVPVARAARSRSTVDGSVGQIVAIQRRFIVGSSATRIDSPSALNARAVSKIAIPGAYICSGARYSYMVEIDGSERTLKGRGLLKYDLVKGTRQQLRFPAGHTGYEVSFAPREDSAAEDDGYLVGFVTNEADLTTEFWITPAAAMADGSIARVKLPQKVPPKFHGRWISADKLRRAR